MIARPIAWVQQRVATALRISIIRWTWEGILAIGRNNVTGMASQLAYSFLFAIVPFLICLLAILSFLPIHGVVEKLLYEVEPFIPRSGYDFLAAQLTQLIAHRHAGLVSVGFLVALASSSNAVLGLMTGLNQIYDVRVDSRSFLVTRGLALLLTAGAGLLALVALVLVIGGGSFGAWLSRVVGHPTLYSQAWNVLRWPVAAALLLCTLVALYLICPDVKLKVRDVLWGALTAAALWVLSCLGFSFYFAHFANFGAAYGSLGTALVLLTWLYVNGLLLLLGGQINAIIAKAHHLGPSAPSSYEPITPSRTS